MSTVTKTRTPAKATNGHMKNAAPGWSLTNEVEIKKAISPFEFTGLKACIDKLFTGGIKFMPLYKPETKLAPTTWNITNALAIEKHITGVEFSGLKSVLGNLLSKGIKMQIVYKNVAQLKAKQPALS